MKKFKFVSLLFLSLVLLATAISCGGGGGSGSDDDDSGSVASSVSGGITGSQVFIDGRTVTLYAKWCCDHEVTQGEYKAIMGTTPSSFSSSPASGEIQDNRPVEFVSWYDCLVYCNKRSIAEGLTPCYSINGKTNPSDWGTVPTSINAIWNAATCNFSANGYRLPTEAEWEYFARGGNTSNSGQTTYSGSNTIGDVAWYGGDNSGNKTHEVKKKAPNAKGLYDMSGNVWEWCWDWYGTITTNTPSTGASSGSDRVIRGGSWYYSAGSCAVQYRVSRNPSHRDDRIGFRLVRSAQ